MCGIFGYNHTNIKEDSFFNLMKHRGPDASSSIKFLGWTLGHLRLSIIDLDPLANQPFEKDGSYLIFNGEIYNYLELKKKYFSDHKFKTQSDTEVLIALLNKFGLDILNELNGMFAFAYLNKKGEMYLVRDRFGVKPLYYSQIDGIFYFASEIKPLINKKKNFSLDQKIIETYFSDTATDYNEKSGFEDIYQIKPGHYKEIKKNKVLNQIKWYQKKKYLNKILNKTNTVENFENILLDSIKIRCRADVPIALTLSGGLDSTLIYTLIKEKLNQNIKPFIFKHKNKATDESDLAISLCKYYGDEPQIVTQTNSPGEDLKDALRYLEFPIWNPSALAYFSMYREIAKKGYKVVLEGHGSDEQLGGYPYMIRAALIESLRKKNFKDYFERRKVFLQTNHLGLEQKINNFNLFRLFLSDIKNAYLISHTLNFQDTIQESFDYKILPIVLRAFDRLSMAHSIESRMPFMDYRLVEFAKILPSNMKVSKIGSKSILRLILKKYGHEKIYSNKKKMGFSSDIPEIFKNKDFHNFIEEKINEFNYKKYYQKQKESLRKLKNEDITWKNHIDIWKIASISYYTKYKNYF